MNYYCKQFNRECGEVSMGNKICSLKAILREILTITGCIDCDGNPPNGCLNREHCDVAQRARKELEKQP